MLVQAGPLSDGLSAVAGVDQGVYNFVQLTLGAIVTVLGGGRAAWQAAHGRDFTGELISAIAGVFLVGASGWVGGFSGQVAAAGQETTSAGRSVGAALGAIVTVIGGGLTAWKLVHGERATGQLVCAIVGVCIAAVSVI